jgi:hypothetical protein
MQSPRRRARSGLRNGEKGDAALDIGTARNDLRQAAGLDGGYEGSPNYVASWISSAIAEDDLALKVVASPGAGSDVSRLAEGILRGANNAKSLALGAFQHAQPEPAEYQAAAGGSCTMTPTGPTSSVDAPGRGTVVVEKKKTAATNSYLAPSEFPITDAATQVEIEVKVTFSHTLPPETRTYTALEDGEFSCLSAGTTSSTSTPSSTSSTPVTLARS